MGEDDDGKTGYKAGPSPTPDKTTPEKKIEFKEPKTVMKKGKRRIGLRYKFAAYTLFIAAVFGGGVAARDHVVEAYNNIANAVYEATHANPSETRTDFRESLVDYKHKLNVYGPALTGVVRDAAEHASPTQLEDMTTATYQKMGDQQKTEFVSTAAQDIGMVCK